MAEPLSGLSVEAARRAWPNAPFRASRLALKFCRRNITATLSCSALRGPWEHMPMRNTHVLIHSSHAAAIAALRAQTLMAEASADSSPERIQAAIDAQRHADALLENDSKLKRLAVFCHQLQNAIL